MIDKIILGTANSIVSNIDVWPLKKHCPKYPKQNSQIKRELIGMCSLVGRYRLDIVESHNRA